MNRPCNVNTSRFSQRSRSIWITRISERTRSSEAVPTSEVSFLPTISENHKIYPVSIYILVKVGVTPIMYDFC